MKSHLNKEVYAWYRRQANFMAVVPRSAACVGPRHLMIWETPGGEGCCTLCRQDYEGGGAVIVEQKVRETPSGFEVWYGGVGNFMDGDHCRACAKQIIAAFSLDFREGRRFYVTVARLNGREYRKARGEDEDIYDDV
jgi:hypothetical protein